MLVALSAAAVTFSALLIVKTPKRFVPPTAPVKTMLPVPAVSVRPCVEAASGSTVLPKVMPLPLVVTAIVLFNVTALVPTFKEESALVPPMSPLNVMAPEPLLIAKARGVAFEELMVLPKLRPPALRVIATSPLSSTALLPMLMLARAFDPPILPPKVIFPVPAVSVNDLEEFFNSPGRS